MEENERVVLLLVKWGHPEVKNNLKRLKEELDVLEALLEHELPEHVIILGTAGSSWSALCEYFYNKTQEKSVEASANPIFASEDEFSNYKSEMESINQMDITHSFRSLPFYQFMFINYFKQVSRFQVELKNVYYGMLECARELNYAPVVNLNVLTDMMDWINGISEVNHYGGTGRIAGLLEDSEDLQDWLKIFEYATSTNDYQRMSYSLEKIIQLDVECLKGLEPHEKHFLKRLQSDLEEQSVVRCIYILGERVSGSWPGVNAQYPKIKKVYAGEKIVSDYLDPILTNAGKKNLKTVLLEYLKKLLHSKNMKQDELWIAMQSTDYSNQSEIVQYLQQEGYILKALKITQTGQVSLPEDFNNFQSTILTYGNK